MKLLAFFVYGGPAVTGLTLLCWLGVVFKYQRQELFALLKRNYLGLIWAFFLSALVFFILPVGFKILSDETNLLSVSRMIATRFQALNAVQGVFLPGGDFIHLENQVPTRPLMFPFLTACLHWVLGNATRNVFILNFILFVALLFSIYSLFKKKPLWLRYTISAVIALNASLAIHATSAGFDLCSLLFALWTFIALWKYLENPSRTRLWVLALTAIMFAQVRYESMTIFAFLAVALIIARGKALWQDLKSPWLWLSSLLLSAALLQRYLTWGDFENRTNEPAFSIANIFKHAPEFLNIFFVQPISVYAMVLNLLGLGSMVFLVRKAQDKKTRIFLGILTSYCVFILALLLAHHLGTAGFPTQIRLFMPLSIALSIAAGFALSESHNKSLVLTALCILQMGLSAVYIGRDHDKLELGVEMKGMRKYLAETRFDAPLFIYRRPGELVALGESAISPGTFKKGSDLIVGYLKDQKIHSIYQFDLSISDLHNSTQGGLPPGWTRVLIESLPLTPLFSLDVYTLIYSPESATSGASPKSKTQ